MGRGRARATTPDLSPQSSTTQDKPQSLQEAKSSLSRQQALAQAGYTSQLLQQTANKQTRSIYTAPDIPPMPSVSLERQLAKLQKEKDPKSD